LSGIIYLVKDDGTLVEMREQPYDSEDVLQELLAKYPNILAGEQIDSSVPRRWLLITREASVPSEDMEGRWSVDHLFLDQDAIPTLVEVKRSKDTRIRREVVGQMLDYASNAVVYWPIESIIALFEMRCEREELNSDDLLIQLLGTDSDAEGFWQKAKTNLQAGKIRMVFVADEIPAELRRVVEFLDEQMDPAQVLAIEVKQYAGEGLKTLVPRVVGKVKETEKPPEKRQWDEKSFFAEIASRCGADTARIAKDLFDWVKEKQLDIWWGRGRYDGSFYPILRHNGYDYTLFAAWTHGALAFQFGNIQTRPVFNDENKRLELLNKLNEIPGFNLPKDSISRYPSVQLSLLGDKDVMAQFITVIEWMIKEIESQ
jgi:hypothetical protein